MMHQGYNQIYDFATKTMTAHSPGGGYRAGIVAIGNDSFAAGGRFDSTYCELRSFSLSDVEYPDGAVIVQYYGTNKNKARLKKDSHGDVVLTVKKVYQCIEGNITAVSAQSNIDGKGWQAV